jgi:hypothetical protein
MRTRLVAAVDVRVRDLLMAVQLLSYKAHTLLAH